MTLKQLDYLWTTTGKHFLLGPLDLHHPRPPHLPHHSFSVTHPSPLCQRWLTDLSVLASHLILICPTTVDSHLCVIWRWFSTCVLCFLSVHCGLYLVFFIHFLSPEGCCYLRLVLSHVHVFLHVSITLFSHNNISKKHRQLFLRTAAVAEKPHTCS